MLVPQEHKSALPWREAEAGEGGHSCLSGVSRDAEEEASLQSQLVERGTVHMGETYFWQTRGVCRLSSSVCYFCAFAIMCSWVYICMACICASASVCAVLILCTCTCNVLCLSCAHVHANPIKAPKASVTELCEIKPSIQVPSERASRWPSRQDKRKKAGDRRHCLPLLLGGVL